MAAVAQLGYVPNIMARQLRQNRSMTIGLCMPNGSYRFFLALESALEELAAADGYEVMHVFSRLDSRTERRRVEMLLRYGIDGVLLLPGAEPQGALDLLAQSCVPTVVLHRPVDDRRFDQVLVDMRSAAAEATRHLLGLGHRRLLFVASDLRLLLTQRRIEGVRLAIRQAACGATLGILERGPTEAALTAQLQAILGGETAPTAIVATNSTGTGWIIQILRHLGVRCPQNISLIAADEPSWAELVQPTLSVIHAPADAVARRAWDLLLRRIRGDAGRPERITLDAELRVAGSVGPVPRRP